MPCSFPSQSIYLVPSRHDFNLECCALEQLIDDSDVTLSDQYGSQKVSTDSIRPSAAATRNMPAGQGPPNYIIPSGLRFGTRVCGDFQGYPNFARAAAEILRGVYMVMADLPWGKLSCGEESIYRRCEVPRAG